MPTPSAFQHVMLEDTFVFSWKRLEHELCFRVLAHLLPTHPDATPPRSGEWACYRDAEIRFVDLFSVVGLRELASVMPTTDADGTRDYGCVDSLVEESDGHYLICGEFGEANIVARGVDFSLLPE